MKEYIMNFSDNRYKDFYSKKLYEELCSFRAFDIADNKSLSEMFSSIDSEWNKTHEDKICTKFYVDYVNDVCVLKIDRLDVDKE